MISTIIGIVCGLVILWAMEMRFNEAFKKNEELRMNILKIKAQLEEIQSKIGYFLKSDK